MLKRNLVLVCFMVVLAVFLMALPASAQKVRGVTDTEIVVGQTGPQTGPAALWGSVGRGTGVIVR